MKSLLCITSLMQSTGLSPGDNVGRRRREIPSSPLMYNPSIRDRVLSSGNQNTPVNKIPGFRDVVLNKFLFITDCCEVTYNNVVCDSSFRVNASSDYYITSNKVNRREHERRAWFSSLIAVDSSSYAFTVHKFDSLLNMTAFQLVSSSRHSICQIVRRFRWRPVAVGRPQGA